MSSNPYDGLYNELLKRHADVAALLWQAQTLILKTNMKPLHRNMCFDFIANCYKDMTGMQHLPLRLQEAILHHMDGETRVLITYLVSQIQTVKMQAYPLVVRYNAHNDETEKVQGVKLNGSH